MKPVRLPAAATRALPRWGLFALALLYILPGLIGRDPWKSDDATGFGIMWSMAHGGLDDWLWPHVAGLKMSTEGPLAYWIGALCIKLFGWALGDVLAARVAIVGFFLLGSLSLWYATYLLGRRSEAQPLILAFGGQPEARDFGRTLADGAFLIYLGCLGLLLHSHQANAMGLQVSLVAFSLFAAVRLFDVGTAAGTPRSGVLLGLGFGALILTRGWVVPFGLWLGLLVLAAVRQRNVLSRLLLITAPLALLIGASWPLANHLLQPFGGSPFTQWMAWNSRQLNWPSWEALSYLLKYEIWFAWPAWPFAAWAVYAWRRQHAALHISLPLTFFGALTILAWLNVHSEEGILLPLLPPLAVLAAFGLPTMKRGAINAVDWFSVMTLTACAGFIWIGWIAKETGWPAQIAKNAFKLAPGFKPEFNLIAVAVAAAASAGWILLVHWRIARRPAVLWRAVVLSSGGVILCWLLLMTLWLPWINYGKSYAGVAEQIRLKLPAGVQCVDSNVGASQRASFAYFGGVRFATTENSRCNYLLLQNRNDRPDDSALLKQFSGQWNLLWEGHRPSDRDERFRLYQRAGS
ncbi:MAG TPA: glycosyltransferase [Burkholderiaceae bacterium]|nr:glycosyltransferase [Burkholderiaceae bacterium]